MFALVVCPTFFSEPVFQYLNIKSKPIYYVCFIGQDIMITESLSFFNHRRTSKSSKIIRCAYCRILNKHEYRLDQSAKGYYHISMLLSYFNLNLKQDIISALEICVETFSEIKLHMYTAVILCNFI